MSDCNTISGAKQSPRFDSGILKWYDGDTFVLDWTVNLVKGTDSEGNGIPYDYSTGDKIQFEFYDSGKEVPVFTYLFSVYEENDGQTDLEGRKRYASIDPATNEMRMAMTSAITALFSAKAYTYCVKYIDSANNVTTISANNKAIVERCH